MAKIHLDPNLYDRVRKLAEAAGYATPEEFIVHIIEKELARLESAQSNEDVIDRLKGLGYLE